MKPFTPEKTYLFTGGALLTLLAMTVGAAYLNLGAFNLVMALGIAAVKAALILLFFMNLRRDNHLIWLAAATGFFWLLIMFTLAMSDFMTR